MIGPNLAHFNMLYRLLNLLLLLLLLIIAGVAADYVCDPTVCTPPLCRCASTQAPVAEPPQLIMLTFDDAITSAAAAAARRVFQHRNTNGCPIRATFFVSGTYTDYHLVTQLYRGGHEIASHSVDHGARSDATQARVLRDTLRVHAHLPATGVQGYRAPYLWYDASVFHGLRDANFSYDCSISEDAIGPVSQGAGRTIWPYTLDAGVAQNCWTGECAPDGSTRVRDLWEIPMASYLDESGTLPIASMDPTNAYNTNETLFAILKRNFLFHYEGNRAPFGLWFHAGFLLGDAERVDAINAFIDFAQSTTVPGSVWFVTGSEVVQFMQQPQNASTYQPPGCATTRELQRTETVCDGVDDDGNGLIDEGVARFCSYNDGSFFKCGQVCCVCATKASRFCFRFNHVPLFVSVSYARGGPFTLSLGPDLHQQCPSAKPTFAEPAPQLRVPQVAVGSTLPYQCAPPLAGCSGGVWSAQVCACECAVAIAGGTDGGFCADVSGACTVPRVAISGRAFEHAMLANATRMPSWHALAQTSLAVPSFASFPRTLLRDAALVPPPLPSHVRADDVLWLCAQHAPAFLHSMSMVASEAAKNSTLPAWLWPPAPPPLTALTNAPSGTGAKNARIYLLYAPNVVHSSAIKYGILCLCFRLVCAIEC